MVANTHFTRLSQGLSHHLHQSFLTDFTILTADKPVVLHKVIFFVFSAHYRDTSKDDTLREVSAKGYSQAEIKSLVDFLYNGEAPIDAKATEMIASLKLDLCVDQRIRRKKVSKGDSVKNIINLELKYLRNLTFEMEIPKLLHNPRLHFDVSIRTGRDVHKCHKSILSAVSVYFEVMFASGMKESTDDIINLQGVESELFSQILTFVYTGTLSLTTSNAQDVLSTSVYLQILLLQGMCEEFLLHQVDTSNCVDMWNLAEAYSCPLLANGAWSFTIDHFDQISRLKLLRNMKERDVVRLLRDDNLCVNSENDVFRFMIDWINSNTSPHSIEDLIDSVRLCLVDQSLLEETLNINPLIESNENCSRLIQAAINHENNSTASTAIPRKEKTFVVVKRSSYTTGIEVACYSLSQKKWFLLQTFTNSSGGTGFATCVVGNSIYVTGGTATPTNNFQFSVDENKWYELPEMCDGRSSHSVGHVAGCLYVLGGTDVSSGMFNIVSTIEKYDIAHQQWTREAKLEIPTYDSAFAVVKSQIYIFGGSMGMMSGVYIKDIQCFDTVSKTCSILYHNLPFTLSLAVACSNNKDIYITCPNGKMIHYDGETAPTTVNQTKGSQLMGFATVYHDNSVYIMGGYSMVGESDTIHRCDIKKKTETKFTQTKLPFKKQTNQLYAAVMHVSRRFLATEYPSYKDKASKGRAALTRR